jgi:hypothetical protein
MFRFVFGWLLGLLPVVLLAADPASPATAMPADAGDTTTPSGEYCPGEESMYLVLEELTVAMEGVSRARESLLVLDDAPAAGMLLARADAALALAVGRGSGARVASLIDAMLAAKKDGHPKARGAKPSDNAFSVLVDLLNRAMSYGLQRLIDLRRT